MWTEITRPKYERRGGRYASDLTDREWALIAPFMPPRKKIGRPRTTELRNVMDAIMYMASTGCQWAMLPNDFPPPSKVQRYFYDWRSNGLLPGLIVHSADIQDRDGAPGVLKSIRHRFPRLRHLFADAAYGGPKLEGALEDIGRWTLEIIRRPDTAKGFEVLPRRWVVERTFAWLNRCRRLAKDWEKSIATAQAWILVAHIRLLTKRLARHCY